MALIFARSPYLVSRDSLDEGAQLKLEIGDYDADSGGFEVEKTFIFNYRNAYYLDVSPFLKDYLDRQFSFIGGDWVANVQKLVRYCRITLSGNISGVAQSDVDFWIDDFRFFEGGPGSEIEEEEEAVSPTDKLPVTWGSIKVPI